MLAVYTIVECRRLRLDVDDTLGFGESRCVLLVGFGRARSDRRHPLLPLRIFRLRSVVGANLIQGLMVAGLFGFQFMSMLYLQRVLGLDAMTTSLAFIPLPLVIATVSLGLSARLNTRFRPGRCSRAWPCRRSDWRCWRARPAEVNYLSTCCRCCCCSGWAAAWRSRR